MQHDRPQSAGRPPHVLIIGGGIGGLCLAQGLKQAGIGVSVYERDRSRFFRGQGWRVTIKENGSEALRRCLPEQLFELCVATSLLPAKTMTFADHRFVPKFSKPVPPFDGRAVFGVNRLTLREILLAGLDDIVHFDATCTGFEQTGDGRVRARFRDGGTAVGDLLVGADGTGSVIRGLVAPGAVIESIGGLIYGRTPIGPNVPDWLPGFFVDSFNRVIGPDGVSFGAVTCRPRTPYPEASEKYGVPLTDMPGYLAWGVTLADDERWSGRLPLPEEEFRSAEGPALHRIARDLLASWPPEVLRVLDEADVPATFPVSLRSAAPVPPWDVPNVTLLGDAIHTMSPSRGEGANIALKDALLLRDALAGAVRKGTGLGEAKARYEAEMLQYGFAAVAASRDRPFAPPRGPRPASPH
jgi:2-polyprenyl-6-methoxyphenol hydroxylase-like FAD-dependent oxidoreductase